MQKHHFDVRRGVAFGMEDSNDVAVNRQAALGQARLLGKGFAGMAPRSLSELQQPSSS